MDITEQTVIKGTREDGAEVDLWVLSAPAGHHAMFEVPSGEDPDPVKFRHLLLSFFQWGSEQVYLAKVHRRYTIDEKPLLAPTPAEVQ